MSLGVHVSVLMSTQRIDGNADFTYGTRSFKSKVPANSAARYGGVGVMDPTHGVQENLDRITGSLLPHGQRHEPTIYFGFGNVPYHTKL